MALKKTLIGMSAFLILFVTCLTKVGAETNSDVPYKVINKTNRLMKGSKVTETINAVDSNGEALTNATITVTIENKNIVAVSIKDSSTDDQVTKSAIIVKTGINGQRSFYVKGLRAGSTVINFETMPEGGKESDKIVEVLKVTVKELKLDLGGDW